MAASHYLACDLGAESGRLMAGSLTENHLSMTEIHRFTTGPTSGHDGASLHWHVEQFFHELAKGLRHAGRRQVQFQSISADSWGLDYILYDEQGAILPPVHHYRDHRTARGLERTDQRVPWPTVFAETGIQRIAINTLYQLAAEEPSRLRRAHRLLLIADAFNHWLGGAARAEVSLASTSQLYNPVSRTWSSRLLEALELPERIFPDIVPSGTRLGYLRPELQASARLPELEVMASCSHDTGAAVAAIPAQHRHWAYISSGTWSLMGTELGSPVLTQACRELNFTNEIGYGNTVRLLKNIVGLWLVQECRRHWASQGQVYDYATLTALAAAAPPFGPLINPSDARFVAPGDMPARIEAYCAETGQTPPASPGAYVRCALESLALLYRRTLRELESLTGHPMEILHIVGGGSQNRLLNQFAANALQIPVRAGPVEATAAGNILVQALGHGHLATLAEAREVVRNSFALETIEPTDEERWHEAAQRFDLLTRHADSSTP